MNGPHRALAVVGSLWIAPAEDQAPGRPGRDHSMAAGPPATYGTGPATRHTSVILP